MGTLYQAGGTVIVWAGIVTLTFFGLCLGAALGKILGMRLNSSPEDVKLGGAVYIGLPKSLLSGAVQFLVTLGVPAAFFLIFRHIAIVNFPSFIR